MFQTWQIVEIIIISEEVLKSLAIYKSSFQLNKLKSPVSKQVKFIVCLHLKSNVLL